MKNLKVKKTIIIALSVVIFLGLAIGLFSSIATFSPALITYREQKQIVNDLHSIRSDFKAKKWYVPGEPYAYFRCYGRENGYILVFCFNCTKNLDYKNSADIDGVVFTHSHSFLFYAYKDGEFIDIADAYEQGLISRAALMKAKEYHDQCQKEIAAAWGK